MKHDIKERLLVQDVHNNDKEVVQSFNNVCAMLISMKKQKRKYK